MRLWLARRLCPKGWRVVPAFFSGEVPVSNGVLYPRSDSTLWFWGGKTTTDVTPFRLSSSADGAWDGQEEAR